MVSEPQLVIVGAGPAGLAAACAAAREGVTEILVIDRDDAPGGLPRYCDHPGFGIEYAAWPFRGPSFVRRLVSDLAGTSVEIDCWTTLTALKEGPEIEIVGPRFGMRTLRPKAIVLALGIRESNRGNRMVPGARPEQGIFTTGQLQQLVARNVALPDHIKKIAVIGTEHVAFSVLWTAKHGGLKVSHLIGEENAIRSFPPARWMARFLGADVILGARIEEIVGRSDRVAGIRCRKVDGVIDLDCDGVVFTAGWIPEISALVGSGIAIDAGSKGPVIDQAMRTNLPGIFASGNMLRPVESSGWAANEGRRAGYMAAQFVLGRLAPEQGTIHLTAGDGLDYIVPQRWDASLTAYAQAPVLRPSLRVDRNIERARLCAMRGRTVKWHGPASRYRPHRRIRLDLEKIMTDGDGDCQLSITAPQEQGSHPAPRP